MKSVIKMLASVLCLFVVLCFVGCDVNNFKSDSIVQSSGSTEEVINSETQSSQDNKENTKEDIIYRSTSLSELAEIWFCTDDYSQIEHQYVDSYIEFDMSCYGYDWVKSIADQYLFTTFLYDCSNEYLQIKFRSIYDVQEIINAELGWDKIIVRGKVRSFNKNGILIEGIEIVEIASYINQNN